MRAAIVFFCAAMLACAHQDQRTIVVKSDTAAATDSLVPPPDAQPVSQSWTPPPASPGDTTPDGFPTEHALLRWVHRVSPDSFPALPKPVHDSLVRRGCQIPVPASPPQNVITGAFTAKGAIEWAVICSIRDTSQILIMNAANGAVVDSLNASADLRWIQSYVNNSWQFSRSLSVVPMSELNVVPADTTIEGVVNYSALLPKPIDHDAIDEAFLGKASSTFYSAHGRWIEIASGD